MALVVSTFNKDFGLHRETMGYASVQSAITAAQDEAGTDAILFTDFTITPVHESIIDEEGGREGRDIKDTVAAQEGPHSVDLTLKFRPSGTAGTAPDIDAILDALFTKASISAVDMDSGVPGTTSFGTTDTGILAADDLIFIPIALSSTTVEAAIVSSVSTLSGVDTVTLKHALSFTPAQNTVIAASLQYKPRNDITTTKFLTLTKVTNIGVESVAGCQPIEFSITSPRNEGATINLKLSGRHHFGAGRTTLSAGINNSTTTIPVTHGNRFFGIDSSHPKYIQIDSEIMKVISVSGNNLTVDTRPAKSTSAASHLQNAEVYVWVADPTVAGSQVPGVQGNVWFDSVKSKVNEMTFSTNEGFTPNEEYGDDEITGFVSAAFRQVAISGQAIGYKDNWRLIASEAERTAPYMVWQHGKTQGKSFGAYCEEVLLGPITIPSAPGDKLNIPFESKAVKGDADDCYRLAIG